MMLFLTGWSFFGIYHWAEYMLFYREIVDRELERRGHGDVTRRLVIFRNTLGLIFFISVGPITTIRKILP